MNKKLTKLEIEKESPEIATASYAKRCSPFKTEIANDNFI